MKANPTIAFLSLLLLASHLHARTWTSSDGKTIEAEFVSGDAENVTIKRSNGRSYTFALNKLSQDDQDYVAKKLEEMKAAKMVTADALDFGDYSSRITGDWVKAEHRKLPYQIYGPAQFEKDAKFPLVIYLHGSGERGSDNEQQVRVQGPKTLVAAANYEKRPCIVIAPQCPEDQGWDSGNDDTIIDLIEDILKRVAIADENRVYITGYSMGSFGTWNLLAKEPKLFAAAVPIAGGGRSSIARDIRKIPIWTFHGEVDPTCSVEDTREIVEALEKVRAPVKYTEMKGEGHGIPGKVYQDVKVHEWLFAQKKD